MRDACVTPGDRRKARDYQKTWRGSYGRAVDLRSLARHAMWRDEVRAFSFALLGDNILAMLRDLRGEGHPALWYLLLRVAHDVVGRPEVLPAVALIVAAAAALLLVLKSPFPWSVICLILAGHLFLFEFSVMARNYGISMLVLFGIAACYRSYRQRGVVLGALLFLLANSNVYSAILVGAFLFFWLVDLLQEMGLRWSWLLTNFALNAAIAMLGVLVCFLTVYPAANDLATPNWPDSFAPSRTVISILDPAPTFTELVLRVKLLSRLEWLPGGHTAVGAVGSLLLFGATLGLVGRPGRQPTPEPQRGIRGLPRQPT